MKVLHDHLHNAAAVLPTHVAQGPDIFGYYLIIAIEICVGLAVIFWERLTQFGAKQTARKDQEFAQAKARREDNERRFRGDTPTTPAAQHLIRYLLWLAGPGELAKMSPDDQAAAYAKRDAEYLALSVEERNDVNEWWDEEIRQRMQFAKMGWVRPKR